MDNETLPPLPLGLNRLCAGEEAIVRAYAIAARADQDRRIVGLAGINEDLRWKLSAARQAITDEVDLRLKAEARVHELSQSAEVAARNMRNLVAEHVRERDALRADRDQCVKNMNDNAEHADKLSERVRELEQKLFESHTNPEWVRAIYDAGYTAQKECDALRAQLDAIQKQPTIEHVNSLGGVSLLIERPELP